MPDYIYLLENRLSPAQQNALRSIREAARETGMTVFLTGGAVRDLTSGSPVRDLDVSVQGKAFDLKPKLKESGAVIWGEHTPTQTIFARFPDSVRVEISSTRREEFPKPGKPVYHPASILDDLRRRDFTANAMALSLNEGSYGLLMDPLNGVADLEARLLRLVSNYGFLEDPIRLIRAARFQARLGWDLEEKTKTRFENAKAEGVISLITPYQQGYEVEEIVHEEDGLKVLKALEAEGWMKVLCPAWTSAKVDVDALSAMRDVLVQLQMQGVNPDQSAAQAQLLTSKLSSKDLAALKSMFVRQGFVKEWESQEERAKEVGKRLLSKEATTPSASWKLLTSADPEAVLWLGLTSKNSAVQQKFKDFFTLWPESRARIPYGIMQEMRITPELEGYQDLVKSIFFELIDGKLNTEEEIRQFLEPHSPPAPPPPVTIRRTRAKKGAKTAEPRDVDEDEGPASRSAGEEDGSDEIDEENELGDERVELIARSAPAILDPPPPPLLPVAPPPAAPATAVPGRAAKSAEEVSSAPPAKPVTQAPAVRAKPELTPLPKEKEKAGKVAVYKRTPTKVVPLKPKPAPPLEAKHKAAKANTVSSKAPASRPLAARRASVKPSRPPGKLVVKPKPALKKSAAKAGPGGKLRKLVSKARSAKAIVKKKAAAVKARPATKAKTSSRPIKKALSAKKTLPAKKRR